MGKDEIIAELGVNTRYEGNLTFKDNLKIKGEYFGSIESGGTLYIDDTAHFEGDINVRCTVIAGNIIGDIIAAEKIEIIGNSVIKGNLKAPIIKIADGVQIEGRCHMIHNADTVDIFTTTVSQLKKSVSIV